MAYKSIEDIFSQIEPTVKVILRIKPIYNFKAGEKQVKKKKKITK